MVIMMVSSYVVIFLYRFLSFIFFLWVKVKFSKCRIWIVFFRGIVIRIFFVEFMYICYGVFGSLIFCIIDLFLLYIIYFCCFLFVKSISFFVRKIFVVVLLRGIVILLNSFNLVFLRLISVIILVVFFVRLILK